MSVFREACLTGEHVNGTERRTRCRGLRGSRGIGGMLTGLALMALMFAGAGWSQEFPSRPIRLVVAWPPGGPTDTISRILAQRLGDVLSQTVIVDNRPGASGMIGSEIVAKGPANGYSLLMVVVQNTTQPSMVSTVTFDLLQDLAPVIKVYDLPFLISANPKAIKVANLRELVEFAKANPGRLQYASSSNGSMGHLGMELLRKLGGFEATHIPYKGSAPAVTDLLGGQVPIMFGDIISVLPHIRSGALTCVALGTSRRTPSLPNCPTIAESGYPGFEAVAWGGIMVRGGTPAPIITRLHQEITKILASPEVRARIQTVGADAAPPGQPEQFGAFLRSETTKWSAIIRERGIRNE